MLGKHLDSINARGVVLASGSIGRKKICSLIGLEFEVAVSGFPEDVHWTNFASVAEYTLFNAREKAAKIESDKVVIAGDTVIELDGQVYEKPVDREDAKRMMREFSGRTHRLVTAVVVRGVLQQEAVEVTELTVDELSEEAIESIADRREEWVNSSGGYSIDLKLGATIFTKVNGCFYNIQGLPASTLAKMLYKEHMEYLKSKIT